MIREARPHRIRLGHMDGVDYVGTLRAWVVHKAGVEWKEEIDKSFWVSGRLHLGESTWVPTYVG